MPVISSHNAHAPRNSFVLQKPESHPYCRPRCNRLRVGSPTLSIKSTTSIVPIPPMLPRLPMPASQKQSVVTCLISIRQLFHFDYLKIAGGKPLWSSDFAVIFPVSFLRDN